MPPPGANPSAAVEAREPGPALSLPDAPQVVVEVPSASDAAAPVAVSPSAASAAEVSPAPMPASSASSMAAPQPEADPALVLPDVPDVAVSVQPAAEAASSVAAVPATKASPDAAPAALAPTVEAATRPSASDLLAAQIEHRLADPQSPLPPKITAREREGIAAFYAATDHRPLWIAEGAWTPAAHSLIGRLGRADEDGLDPADYPIPNLSGGGQPLGADDLAEAELKLSAAAYLYARAARGGRIEPSRLSALVTPELELPSPERVLSEVGGSDDAGGTLQGFNPAYPGYLTLREKLAELRGHRPAGLAKARGAVVASAGNGLPHGVSPRLEGDLIANMERWRWLPSQVSSRYILVNIPEYRLRLVEGGDAVHETRVVVGTPATPTPVFTGTMDHAIVNPSWYIPPSILRKEILPGLAKDPNYAAKRGYTVTRRGNATTVRQPPGPRNALGYVKFMFPNDHAVYLHDTPSRHLFGSARRAFSHGCVRVENPFALGDKILGDEWSEGRLKSLIGRGERTIFMPERFPVHLSYFTVTVDDGGKLSTFEDVYGLNRRVRAALGLGG